MKKTTFYLMLTGILCASCSQTEQSFLDTKDAYFGLTPPGLIPEVFAPGIVSDSTWAEHCQVAVSPNGDEIFWSAWSSKYPKEDGTGNTEQIYYSKYENGIWTKPTKAEFIKNNIHGLNGGPVFSPDGKRLFFYQVKSPWTTSAKNTYYVENVNGDWSSEPINAGPAYNSEGQNYSPVFSKNGFAYESTRGIILKYAYTNDKFTLTDTLLIHKDFRPAWNIYVSPKEDYVIFAAMHKDGFGDIDLYVSNKSEDDKWEYPINLGAEVNTELRERFPVVSPDGKYLFFMRHTPGQDIFWVSSEIIENLRNKSSN